MTEPMFSPPALGPDEGDALDMDTAIPHRPLAGNTSDDDGEALDAFFQPMDARPQVYGIPETTVKALTPPQRLITRFLPVGNDPLMLFPPDINRKSLRIIFRGAGSDVLQMASTRSDVEGSGFLAAATGPEDSSDVVHYAEYVFPGYTGGVWLRARTIASGAAVYGVGNTLAVSGISETL